MRDKMGEEKRKINLLFVWHMHQPDYFDPDYSEIELPWVKLHGCKGYTDMAWHLQAHPGIKATFNFSGTLLRELALLASDTRRDRYRELSMKRPEDLTYDEKVYILKHFFSLAPQAIKTSPRMFQLLGMRGRNICESSISEVHKRFDGQDFMDLQVLFNLLWMGTGARSRLLRLGELERKGSGFTQEEKEEVLDIQRDVSSAALQSYLELQSRGQIEISFTPYYHPILPLLLDSSCASQGLPGLPLPEGFSFPEDARWHVTAAMEEYKRVLGRQPAGMWPAEGSVSEQVVSLADELGVRWIGTDEGVLWRSLRSSLPGSVSREELLFRPYRLSGFSTAIFFRDHYLSDRLGFTYQSMDIEQAVDDFFAYLARVSAGSRSETPVVTVIMDGENPWSYYPDDGAPFLEALYGRLEEETWIETKTPSEVLARGAACGDLAYLFPGSWIDANFGIWIGDHAKNRAWTLLADTRRAVAEARCPEEKKEEALAHVMAAEGSDWFWWYGEPNSSTEDPIFDQLFRSRLRSAMRAVGAEIPVSLLRPPGVQVKPVPVVKSPLTFIHPGIDGTGEKYFEWYNAGQLKTGRASGTMTTSPPLFSTVYYGFDYDFIYARLDPLAIPAQTVAERLSGVSVRIVFDEETDRWVEISLPSPVTTAVVGAAGTEPCQVAFDRILEAAVPIRLFEFKRGAPLRVFIVVMRSGLFVERYPDEGTLEITVPDENWDKVQWIV
jgi:alpha-amylase/alpha-mannosidase (GH57 family)